MAITIPANTVAFLTKVKNDLSVSSITSGPGAPINFCLTQDVANVLRLLQNCLSSGTALTATGGSTTTVVDGASTFVANTQVGFVVTMLTGTALNIGQSRTIIANTTTTLTVGTPFPASVAASDTYSIRAAIVDAEILHIMDGHDVSKGENSVAYTYPNMRTVQSALTKLLTAVSGTVSISPIFTTTAVAGTSTTAIKVDTKGTSLRIDEFKNFSVTIGGVRRRVVGNTENTLNIDFGVTAPSGGEAVVVGHFADDTSASDRCANVLSGGQPGDNARLAAFIGTVQTAIAAFTVPV